MKEKIALLTAAGLMLALFINLPLFAQTDTVSIKDQKFYEYSINQLNSANKSMQEQLAGNQVLINRLQTEKDSLVSLLKKFQSGAFAPPVTVAAQPKAEMKAESKVASKAPVATAPVIAGETDFESAYRMAYEKFNQRDYKQSAAMFQELLNKNRNHSLSDNCQYWIGECYYCLNDYKQATIEFEKVLTFKNTNKDDDAQLKLGLCYIRLNDKVSAKRELTRLLSNYPDSEFTKLGRKLLEGLQ